MEIFLYIFSIYQVTHDFNNHSTRSIQTFWYWPHYLILKNIPQLYLETSPHIENMLERVRVTVTFFCYADSDDSPKYQVKRLPTYHTHILSVISHCYYILVLSYFYFYSPYFHFQIHPTFSYYFPDQNMTNKVFLKLNKPPLNIFLHSLMKNHS